MIAQNDVLVQEREESDVGRRKKRGRVEGSGTGYVLSKSELRHRLSEWHRTGVFQSPYSRGVSTDFLNALARLGLNQPHANGAVRRAIEEEMSGAGRRSRGMSDFDYWCEKHNPKATRLYRVEWRIHEIFRSLHRLNPATRAPVGLKLAQMGCCVDICWYLTPEGPGRTPGKNYFYRLNTHSSKPLLQELVVAGIRGDEAMLLIPPVDFSQPTLGPAARTQHAVGRCDRAVHSARFLVPSDRRE
jgi:hypothetical protein